MDHRNREMFAEYPDVVDVEQLCKMLGGISRKRRKIVLLFSAFDMDINARM